MTVDTDLSTKFSSPSDFTLYSNTDPVIRIEPSGDIYWKERLIESDEDFKSSMMELLGFFKGISK